MELGPHGVLLFVKHAKKLMMEIEQFHYINSNVSYEMDNAIIYLFNKKLILIDTPLIRNIRVHKLGVVHHLQNIWLSNHRTIERDYFFNFPFYMVRKTILAA